MSVATMFERFTVALKLPTSKKTSIANRTASITRRLNLTFRSNDSSSSNRFYGGSYGRATAVDSLSDVDLLCVLPYSTYQQYDAYASEKQSKLLQAVRSALLLTYPNSSISVDGQIVKIPYVDGITFEIVPVFLNTDGSYTYPDTNNGGSWRLCKPKHETDTFSQRNRQCNRNLVELGRMVRAWRDANSVRMSGMLIDTLCWQFIETWAYKDKSFFYYDYLTRDFFKWMSDLDENQTYWRTPGSESFAWKGGPFHAKARAAHQISLSAIEHLVKSEYWSASQKYRSIYGNIFSSWTYI